MESETNKSLERDGTKSNGHNLDVDDGNLKPSSDLENGCSCKDQVNDPRVSSAKHEIDLECNTQEQVDSSNVKGETSNVMPMNAPQPPSKKSLKRQRRWEEKLAVKKRRKEHAREAKRAKAILDGRDVEKERLEVERRTKEGEGHKRREKLIMDRITSSADKSFQVCIDCAFEEFMTEKEINSLASQIRYCYASNKRSPNPIYLTVSSLAGSTRAILDKVDGFPEGWVGRGFFHHAESMELVHDISKLVYLTSDSPNVLQDLDNEMVYVIGGIVDRNRLKRATINRADHLGIATAKLPITDHLKLFSTKVLTCNHVFEILLKYRECGNDWKKAMIEVLPERKDVQEK